MMQFREIKSFLFSQHFSDGLRITFGVLLPSLVYFNLDKPTVGLMISIGAVCVSIADSQGPINHKRNGMFFCNIFVFFTAILTGLINDNPYLIGLEILLLCFIYSMFSVYGDRASSIGSAALLAMILSINKEVTEASGGAFNHAFYMLAGGIWYMLLSLSLSQLRPYRLAQQAMGECIQVVADYVRLKAALYDDRAEIDENYKKLIAQQVIVHEQQDSLRELLFKTRVMVKETTFAGRLLILVFVDVMDLFEQTMATHYDYHELHKRFEKSDSLKHLKKVIVKLAVELENLSYFIISNEMPHRLNDFKSELENLKQVIDGVEESGTNALVLKKILINIRNMSNRIDKIYSYFNNTQNSAPNIKTHSELNKFVSHQTFDIKVLKENLSLKSSIFRHSVRVALMCLIGFLVSKMFPVGHHSYWILLTIMVILKPAYSLTKQRNVERLIGTLIGGIGGALILIFVANQTVLFVFLLLFMIGSYSFQKLNHTSSIVFMTLCILILFSFLGANNLQIAQERIVDTFIGSFIALFASYLILPNWELHQLKDFMQEVLLANFKYLQQVANTLAGKPIDDTAYKLIRKRVYVSSANLGSAFQRMTDEPKSKQGNIKDVHNFVVFNHMLSSYIATLMTNVQHSKDTEVNEFHIKLIRKSLYVLSELIQNMSGQNFKELELNIPELKPIGKQSNESDFLLEQLELVHKLTRDLQKLNPS